MRLEPVIQEKDKIKFPSYIIRRGKQQ